MTDPYAPARYPAPADQHDTTALLRPGTIPPTGPIGNPEAEYWAARYRRQRTWTWLLASVLGLGLLGMVGLGVVAWRLATANPLTSVASAIADGLDGGSGQGESPPGLLPEGLLPDGVLPEDGLPEGAGPDAAAPDQLPLPGWLRGFGEALGIGDLDQLLDRAVEEGLMTREQADALRASLEATGALD